MVKVRQNLVSSNLASKVTYTGTNTKQYIIIHETANTSKGANADAHGRLQANGNSRSASWQYSVDDKEIVQSFSDNAQCWHAGNASYNKNSIGVEICVNRDGDYKKAVNNAIELVKYLMKRYNIPTSNVIQHNKASGKDCPRYLRNGSKGGDWKQFKSRLSDTSTSTSKPSQSTATKPKPPAKPTKPATKGNQTTTSIVVYLQSINQPFSYAHRSKLARDNGINGYKGSSVQNLLLLDKLRKGGSNPTQPTSNLKVDGKWGTATTRALQRYFKTKEDGVISKPSAVIKALQRLLGVKADGFMGVVTIRAMQRRFKMKVVDGVISKPVSAVVKELQRRLNSGKL